MTHATAGLALIDKLPESPERLQQELTLHLMRAFALQIQHGFGGQEAAEAYHRADIVSRQLPVETPQRLVVLLGLWGVAMLRARHQEARQLTLQCLDLAERFQRPAPLIRAHVAVGLTLFYMGDFRGCRSHLDIVNELYDPARRHSHSDIQDPRVVSLANIAFALWFQGYPDQALAKSQAALARARDLEHLFTLAAALIHTAALHHHRREPHKVAAAAEELLAMPTVKEFGFWFAAAQVFLGWGWLAADCVAAGIESIERGLHAYRATGSKLYLPYLLMLLAEGYRQANQNEAALSTLTEALTLAEKSGENWSAAELYRQYGELCLNLPTPRVEQAESCYHRAITIARQQGAKTLELRSTVSLRHLWLKQGKATLFDDCLTPLYSWFTEGHTTVDLQEARAALERG